MRRYLFLVAAGWLIALGAAAQGPALEVGLNESPGLAYRQDDGELAGPVVRLARALLAHAGIPASIGIYPASRVFRGLREGDVHFSLLVRAPVLESCCLFSRAPVLTQVLRLYSLGDTPLLSGKEELVGRALIVLQGYSYAGMMRQVQDEGRRNRIEVARSLDTAIQMLERGRGDYLLAYEANMRELPQAGRIPDLRSTVLARIPVHMVMAKSAPQAAQRLARLEEVARTLAPDAP